MSRRFHRFALVIPTLNEVGNITSVLDRAVAALSHAEVPWNILVVDDESSDGTAQVVQRYFESEPRVRLVTRTAQSGLAGAITYGWAQTDADLIGVMDADLQHPPELLPNLIVAVANGADLAIASRYANNGSVENWSWLRKAVSRVAVLASRPVQRQTLRVQDPMSGFFVLRRQCITGLEFQPAGFKLLLEILARGRINSVAEVPFTFASRHSGASKANAMTAVHYFVLLYRLSRDLIFGSKNRPSS
jgi:dolichol-phosphate mannosyltransferase